MTGGPNSHKQPIDYEFSQYDRNDLIYKFAKDVEDEKMSNYLPQQKQVDE